jgi:transcriptional regulator with XRE-family HTH domain
VSDDTRSAPQLIAAALKKLPENNYEAAGLLGVSEGTIRRWREGKTPSQLRAETRNALAAFLNGGPRLSVNGNALRAWEVAEAAAKLRAQALADVAAALKLEAKAADERAVAIRGHTQAMTAEAESARERVVELRGKVDKGQRPQDTLEALLADTEELDAIADAIEAERKRRRGNRG